MTEIFKDAGTPIAETSEEAIELKTLVDYLQKQIFNGEYDLLEYPVISEKLSPKLYAKHGWWKGHLLPGVDNILAYKFFNPSHAARHELYPLFYGFNLVQESDDIDLQTYLAFALARMSFEAHLPEIFLKQGDKYRGLPMFFALELIQSGDIAKAIQLITADGALEAIQTGDKSLFDSIMCLSNALKYGNTPEGAYCTVFTYACSRLPELIPYEAKRDIALKSLERFVLNDSFFEKDNQQPIMLRALIGAMLRSGEFDRAEKLQLKLNSLPKKEEFKNWHIIFYLDAAVFWYLNGNFSNMIEVLSRLLRNHLPSVSQ